MRYRHSYGRIVDLNDTDISKTYIAKHPELAERTFNLRPPPKRGVYVPHAQQHRQGTGEKTAVVPRGALARAVKAGLVSRGLLAVSGA